MKCKNCGAYIDNPNAIIYLPTAEANEKLMSLNSLGLIDEAAELVEDEIETFSPRCIRCWIHGFVGLIYEKAHTISEEQQREELDGAVDMALQGISLRTYFDWMGDPKLN